MKFFRLIIFFLLAGLCIGGVRFFLKLKQSIFWSLKRVNLMIISRQPDKAGIMSFDNKTGKIFFLPEGKKVEDFYLPVFGCFSGENINFDQRIFWQGMKKNIQTDLSFEDLLVLFLRSKKIAEFSKEEKFLGNKSEEYFIDSGIIAEAMAVEILNATKHDSLAQNVSLLWENIGGRVVRVADSGEEGQFVCRIAFAGKVKDSYSLKIMKEIYGCETGEMDGTQTDRVDLSLTLGEDYWKKIGEKW